MLNRIGEFVSAFFGQMIDLVTWFLEGIVYVISEVFYAIYSGILTILEAMISAIDYTVIKANAAFSQWDLLPDQLLYVLGELHFGQALALLSSAYLIRLTLNLIPGTFTRV